MMKTFETLPGTTIFQVALMRDMVRSIGWADKLEDVQPLVGEIDDQLDVLMSQATTAAEELKEPIVE